MKGLVGNRVDDNDGSGSRRWCGGRSGWRLTLISCAEITERDNVGRGVMGKDGEGG